MSVVVRSVASIIAGFVAVVMSFLTLGYLIFELTDIRVVPFHSPDLHTPATLIAALIRLLASVAIGGFAVTYVSKTHLVVNPAILGCLMLLLALFDGLPPGDIQPIWYTMLTLALLVPSAIAGALVGRAMKGS
jgi:hypothetical protein